MNEDPELAPGYCTPAKLTDDSMREIMESASLEGVQAGVYELRSICHFCTSEETTFLMLAGEKRYDRAIVLALRRELEECDARKGDKTRTTYKLANAKLAQMPPKRSNL
jgi:hypothetical protein